VLALNGEVYDATSPPMLEGHVLLRKLYSIGAFALLGAAYAFARRRFRVLEVATAVGIYSGAIEIGQWFVTDEPLLWNLVDVACGIAGGALGALLLNRLRAVRGR
jgi:hypothetical protein